MSRRRESEGDRLERLRHAFERGQRDNVLPIEGARRNALDACRQIASARWGRIQESTGTTRRQPAPAPSSAFDTESNEGLKWFQL